MLLDILIISAPGIVLALGALAAEYAGVMTIFGRLYKSWCFFVLQ